MSGDLAHDYEDIQEIDEERAAAAFGELPNPRVSTD
jgi:hypothetical protein